jgi:dipeptidyl aminopeptidase/acylaminoacyl peptidase
MNNRLTILFYICLAAAGPAAAQEDVWTPEKAMQERTVNQIAVSPDGMRIACCVREAVMEPERSEYLIHIWVASTDGSRNYQLTRGDKSCSSPAWSPDGKRLAFLSERSGKNNIWLIRPDFGEATRLTDVETGVELFRWSPDGNRIAFTMTDSESEEEKAAKKAKRDPNAVGKNIKFTHIYVATVENDDGFPSPAKVTKGKLVVNSLDWSPDGKRIAFAHQPLPGLNYMFDSDISVVGAEGGEIKPLVRQPGIDTQPRFSPDGTVIAFQSARGQINWAFHGYIALVPAAGGAVKYMPPSHDLDPTIIGWKGDGSGVYFSEAYRTSIRAYFTPADGGTITPALSFEKGCVGSNIDVSPDGTVIAYSYETMDTAPELYARRGAEEPIRLTKINAELPKPPHARSEVISWKSIDGNEIEGILTYPLDYKEGARYPLLLVIHGGPMGYFQQTYTAEPDLYPVQAFAAKGFAVLRPNPRGSGAYGLDFRTAIVRDWGGVDYNDLMAGVNHLVNTGLADRERLGVMGWSYGGYMTSWIISQTDRFKAASVGAGLPDLFSFTNTTDVVDFLPAFFEAETFENDAIYRERSALFNIFGATTPTLIQHGERDYRVPPGQAWELYWALKRQGTETELVLYPRTPHVPLEPKLLLDIAEHNLRWFCEKVLPKK